MKRHKQKIKDKAKYFQPKVPASVIKVCILTATTCIQDIMDMYKRLDLISDYPIQLADATHTTVYFVTPQNR